MPNRRSARNAGFTLIELMIVVSILGLLAAIAIPAYMRFQTNARCARTAAELRNMSNGFVAYLATHGNWPADSHAALPPGMDEFIRPAIWTDGTPLGGNYNWEGPETYPYAGISIFPADALSAEEKRIVDSLLDDGNLATGKFRDGTSGRPIYIITE